MNIITTITESITEIGEPVAILKPTSRPGLEILKGYLLSRCPKQLACWVGLEREPVYSDPVNIAKIRWDESAERFRVDYTFARASVGLANKPLDIADPSTSLSEDELIVPILVDILAVEGKDPLFRWELDSPGPCMVTDGLASHLDPHLSIAKREI